MSPRASSWIAVLGLATACVACTPRRLPSIVPVALPPAPDVRYLEIVRPILTRHGCDAGPCHGTFRGGGLYLSGGHDSPVDYATVVSYVDLEHPRESLLLKKALGEVLHNGGRNLELGACDTTRLLAWMSGAPDPSCTPPPPPRLARFTREVVPALAALGCAAGACHRGGTLDLSGPPERTLSALEANRAQTAYPWRSPLVRAASGDDHHAASKERWPCAYRRLYGWVAGAPETACDPTSPAPLGPDPRLLGDVVMPALARRGCTHSGCHGGSALEVSLFDPGSPASETVTYHAWVTLTARVERPAAPEDSTLLRTLRNDLPHGGGRRLGGPGDCVDALLVSWLRGEQVVPCGVRAPPDYARFADEVQPVLEKMTCTQRACHGETLPSFRVTAARDPAALRANYGEVLAEIDRDFTPLSGVMLRMREPCAYAVTAAWIDGLPKPDCVVHDPAPGMFPRPGRNEGGAARAVHPSE